MKYYIKTKKYIIYENGSIEYINKKKINNK